MALGVDFQSAGVGSRGNNWEGEEGNFYFSFCLKTQDLPKDLLLESISIYFSCIMKEVLADLGSRAWIKWPNDFYIDDTKIGGVITTKIHDTIIGSIGLNIAHAPQEYGTLDVSILPQVLAKLFLEMLEKNFSWKQIFSKYKLEFDLSRKFFVHVEGKKISLQNATLLKDGSLEIQNKRVYSLR